MKLVKILFFALLSYSAIGQGIKTPSKSPLQTLKQEFALSSIEIEYSRPSARGRVIYGDLVPFGNLWRTGANNQTLITLGENVEVNGVAVKGGKYTILTKPGKDTWEVLLCTPTTSVFNFDEKNVVYTFTAKTEKKAAYTETFTISFGKQTDNTADIHIDWENTSVNLAVKADIDSKIMADIEKIMKADSRPYFAAASYYYDNDKDMNKALEWINKALEQDSAFFITHVKAKIQLKAGDKKGALETANLALKQAENAKNADYIALNKKLIASIK